MGWVKEKSATGSWKWKYLVMTEYSLYLYDKAPVYKFFHFFFFSNTKKRILIFKIQF